MKTILLALVIGLHAQAAWAFTVATGPSDGSYFQIAQDIKNVAGKEGIDIQVMPTKGSLENIQLLGTGKVGFGHRSARCAPQVCFRVLKQGQGLNLFESIKVILNLYPEEIHILSTKSDIQTFYGLEGNGCRWGPPGGGTAVTPALRHSTVYDIKAIKIS